VKWPAEKKKRDGKVRGLPFAQRKRERRRRPIPSEEASGQKKKTRSVVCPTGEKRGLFPRGGGRSLEKKRAHPPC